MAKKRKRKLRKQQTAKKSEIRYPAAKKALYTHGPGSPLDLHARGELHRADTVIWLYLERHSNWDTGMTHKLTAQGIAQGTGYHVRTVYRSLKVLAEKDFLQKLTPPQSEYLQFQLWPYDQPVRPRKERLTSAAPMGSEKDPWVLLRAGEVCPETLILWHHLNLDWQKFLGVTQPIAIARLAKQTGVSARKIWDCVKEAAEQLFRRISQPKATSIFHLCLFAKPTDATQAEADALAKATPVDPDVVCMDTDGITHYKGERYKSTAEGWHRWMAPIRKWVFVNQRIPGEIHAYCQTQREGLLGKLNHLPV